MFVGFHNKDDDFISFMKRKHEDLLLKRNQDKLRNRFKNIFGASEDISEDESLNKSLTK